ncbi:MAG: HAMP domain-containing sensor histidine kinase [Oscillospiraceae bacterium]
MNRKQMILEWIPAVIGGSACAYFNWICALILLVVCVSIFAIQAYFQNVRKKEILSLCDKIDEILNGSEHTKFDEFQEGEISILSAEIHKMTIRIREQNSALLKEKQFMKESLEDMSHQLRTPLTTMIVILGMLRKPDLPKQERMEHIQELYSLLSRMQWMLETLLRISRLDAGAVSFQKQEISVQELIKSAVEPIEISLELKDIALVIEIEDNPLLNVDLMYMTEAILNILKNCMEHTPHGGTITIQSVENVLYTNIIITDTGNGISPQDLPHLFERFYQGEEFSRKGFGLGLAFAQKIITSQHGSIQVKNASPHGALFDIRIYKTESI